jgi:hypothetical protein
MVFASISLVTALWPAYFRYTIIGHIITIAIFIVCLFALGEISQAFRGRIAKTLIWWRNRESAVSVPAAKVAEAQMVIRRTSIIMSKKEDILAEQEEQEKLASQATAMDSQAEQSVAPETKGIGEPVLLAEKDDVGEILYYEEDDKYELRLDMEFYKRSHFMSGEEWEEFIDFSAQRQEFFILLKEKYPELAALIKENKMRPSFLKLIEYSYGKSQPPKKK